MLIITKENNSIKVVGQNNPTYPYSGTLVYPLNSVTVVTDQSDMAVFRSALNNDVLFTGLIENITIAGSAVTKEDIGTKFGAIANSSGSGGGGTGGAVDSVNGQTGTVVLTAADVNAYSKAETDEKLRDYTPLEAYATEIASIKKNMGNKADKSSLDNYLLKTDAQANYQAKLTAGTGIEITGENVINVTLDTNIYQVVETLPESEINTNKIYLVLNSESGESDLYTEYLYVNNKWEKIGEYKADVDLTPYLTKADAADTYQPKGEYLTSIPEEYVTDTELEGKGYALNTSLEAEVTERQKQDSALGGMIAGETQAREQAINNLTATVQGKLDTATYNQDKATFATKTEIPDTSDLATKTELSEGLAGKANTSDLSNYLTTANAQSTYATKSELGAKLDVETYNSDKATFALKSEIPDTSDLATKEELNGKQNTLVSGTNIKTVNGNSLLGSGNITISGGGSGIATWDYAQIQSDQEYRTNFLSNVKVSDDLTNLGGSDNPEHASILTIDGNVYTVMYNVGGNPKVASINIQESVATITNIDAIPKNVATTTENGLMSSADKTKLDSIGEVPTQYVQSFTGTDTGFQILQAGSSDARGGLTFSEGFTVNNSRNNPVVSIDTETIATKTELQGKQDTLVSGTNIKTVNGNSLLGSGNITISGGGSGTEVYDFNGTSKCEELTFDVVKEGVILQNITLSDMNITTNGVLITLAKFDNSSAVGFALLSEGKYNGTNKPFLAQVLFTNVSGATITKYVSNTPTLQDGPEGNETNYVYSKKSDPGHRVVSMLSPGMIGDGEGGLTVGLVTQYWGDNVSNSLKFDYASSTMGGMMRSKDKNKLDTMPSQWFGTQSQFDGIETKDENTLYFITEE